ncbi:MAG: glycosyltransferase family 4 protein [Candidatus Magasanikbacteria bacterium]|nr:glycosyltransferase family 4 protein [Candidatus Magasanikbacteria bacterium]
MKILIAADIFPPQAGGPATYSVTLANELVKQGVEVCIVSLNPQSDKTVVTCPMYCVSSTNKRSRYLQYFWLLFRHALKVDLIYAMGPVNAGWPTSIVARVLHKKFVVKVVGDYAWEQGVVKCGVKESVDEFQNKTYSDFVGRLQKAERLVVQKADRVIVPSKYLAGMVQGWGAPGHKVEVVYNSIEMPSEVKPAEKPAGERWVVSVARLVPWKGVEAVMRAVKELQGQFPGLKLKIIGDGPDRSRLEAIQKELGLFSTVSFFGNVPRAGALSYIAAADVVVLNSGYEGLSHILLEARFLGRTTIASRIGGNPEVLADNYLFPWNDVGAIKECLNNALLHPAEPVTAEFAKRFRFETMIAETKKILEEVCAS